MRIKLEDTSVYLHLGFELSREVIEPMLDEAGLEFWDATVVMDTQVLTIPHDEMSDIIYVGRVLLRHDLSQVATPIDFETLPGGHTLGLPDIREMFEPTYQEAERAEWRDHLEGTYIKSQTISPEERGFYEWLRDYAGDQLWQLRVLTVLV